MALQQPVSVSVSLSVSEKRQPRVTAPGSDIHRNSSPELDLQRDVKRRCITIGILRRAQQKLAAAIAEDAVVVVAAAAHAARGVRLLRVYRIRERIREVELRGELVTGSRQRRAHFEVNVYGPALVPARIDRGERGAAGGVGELVTAEEFAASGSGAGYAGVVAVC